jgi:hypothetical protein
LLLLLTLACGVAGAASQPAVLFVNVTGSDAGRCTKAAPCRSFDRAYAVARPGQIVEIAGGEYGDEDVNAHGSRSGSAVIFRPASGEHVVVDDIDVGAAGVEFSNLTIRTWTTTPAAHDVTFRGIRNNGFWIVGSTNVRVIGGSVGPGVDVHSIIQAGGPKSNILIEGVSFHDWTRSGPDVHTECLQIGGGNGITIRRSRFENCAVMDLHISHWGDSPPTRNVLIENNVFDEPVDGSYAIQATAFQNVVIRNNSSLSSFVIFDKSGPGPVTLTANVAPAQRWECNDDVIYRHNVWTNVTCDPTDRRAASGFRDPRRLDLRLKGGAAAIDRGDPKSFPTTDIDRGQRPRGRGPDAGAYESSP